MKWMLAINSFIFNVSSEISAAENDVASSRNFGDFLRLFTHASKKGRVLSAKIAALELADCNFSKLAEANVN